ncbi:MAG: zinc-dependent dehydrogenase [Anaerolineales bacterium]|nr:zinc-dependent dehydrogenase [Anaerolineales bacterium]
MLAAIYDGTNQIKVVQRPRPTVGSREALLRVEACGVCGTDLRILRAGHQRIPEGANRILGHELSGVIEAVGSDVTGLQVGTRVALAPNMGCGRCDMCIRGFTNLCPAYTSFGVVIDGGFAEYMLITAEAISQGNIYPLPDNVSFQAAAMNEPLACCFHGLSACHVQPGDDMLVIGMGSIGLMTMQLGRLMGVRRMITANTSSYRRERSLELGADVAVNPSEQDLVEAVLEATDGRGVDVAIVAAPSSIAQQQCLELAAKHGRINFFGGLPKGSEMTTINANLVHYKELTITGTTGQTVAEYRTTMKLLSTGRLNIDPLVTGRFALKDTPAAIENTKSKIGVKTMIFPHESLSAG